MLFWGYFFSKSNHSGTNAYSMKAKDVMVYQSENSEVDKKVEDKSNPLSIENDLSNASSNSSASQSNQQQNSLSSQSSSLFEPSNKPAITNNSSQNQKNNEDSNKNTHTHHWEEVVEVVQHEAIKHPERKLIQEAYDEPIYETVARDICNQCRADVTDNYEEHYMSTESNCGGNHTEWIPMPTGETIHHDAKYEDVLIIDKEAWNESVITGYRCSCGATKAVNE